MTTIRGVRAAACAWLMAGAVVAAQGAAGREQAPTPSATADKAAPTDPALKAQASGAADAAFMKQASMSGMAEVEHGRLAAEQASSPDVKQFAQRMVDDHSKANDELKALASSKKVTLPTELDPKHRAMQDRLSKLKGAAFDRAYMSHMVPAHAQAVTLFQQESKTGKDAETKAWAAKTLPTIQEHHKMARDLSAKSGGGK